MYKILSLISGILISIMVAVNGVLTEQYGLYLATVIIHITGLLVISIVILSKKQRVFQTRYAWYLYTGGAIGILTVLFNNIAFGRISISAILALGLLGQSICGLLIDQYGWLDMPTHTFKSTKLIGLIIIVFGIAAMINSFHLVAVLVSLASGITIVISRTINAKLGSLTSVHQSTFFNYLVGTIGMLLIFLILGKGDLTYVNIAAPRDFWMYFGGALGVCIVMLFNIVVVKVSAFYVTLLSFIGQVFMGLLLDAFLLGIFSIPILIGGVCVTLGFCVNLLIDRKEAIA